MTTMKPRVWTFFDEATFTATHVVAEPDGARAMIIDSVLDFDAKSGRTSTASADEVIAHVEKEGLAVEWILETHVHADHLTAAPYLKGKLGGKIGVGSGVTTVQETFKAVFHAECSFRTDGTQFDHLFEDDETFMVGALEVRVIHTPGHTPALRDLCRGRRGVRRRHHVHARLRQRALRFPRRRCAHALPVASARSSRCRSIPVSSFATTTRPRPDRTEFAWETTVAEVREKHIHLHDGIDEDAFVKMRTERDKTLDMPQLILPSVQINMRAGAFPPPEENGVSYLKLPLNAL